jgi:hypothetical protein
LDDGATWTRPRVLYDGPLDDRDAGILETASGALIATWFTSMAWQTSVKNTDKMLNMLPAQRHAWMLFDQVLKPATVVQHIGCWALRSTDGGATWTGPIDTVANSPHGPIRLADGALLYPGKHRADRAAAENGSPFVARIGASISRDDGATWTWHGDIPETAELAAEHLHELHGVQAANGDVVVHIRNHNETAKSEILQTVSRDGGATWSAPVSLGLWGYPNHLTRLADDTLLSTYGHRAQPLSIRATVSRDHGATWSEPATIADIVGGDFGYPATAPLADGSLYTIWYARRDDAPITELRAARWRLV